MNLVALAGGGPGSCPRAERFDPLEGHPNTMPTEVQHENQV